MAKNNGQSRGRLADRLADIQPTATTGHDPLEGADAQLLLDAIRSAGAAGFGISFSFSRDGGAVKIGLLDDGQYEAIGWSANSEELTRRLNTVMQVCWEAP